jgi:hypothetical protein
VDQRWTHGPSWRLFDQRVRRNIVPKKARSRSQAATGAQREIRDAETDLTEPRTTGMIALGDYLVAMIRLEQTAAYLGAEL